MKVSPNSFSRKTGDKTDIHNPRLLFDRLKNNIIKENEINILLADTKPLNKSAVLSTIKARNKRSNQCV